MYFKHMAGIGLAAALSFLGGSAFAETVTIKYSNWMPTNHFLVADIYKPYFDEIEKATEGRVKIEMLPKVVGTAATQFDVVRDGLADMSYVTVSYTPGRFPNAEMGDLPLMGNNAETMAAAFWHHFKKWIEPSGEFKDVKVLSMWMITPLQPHTKTRPIRAVADFKGLKMRTINPNMTKALELAGGIPIHKSATEAFEMLSTGVIDGQITIPSTIPGFNQLDLLKYVTIIPGGMSNAANMMFINKDVWARISEEDRAAIEALSGEKLARSIGAAYLKADEAAYDIFRKAGYEIIEADDATVQELTELWKPVEEAWIKRAADAGVKDPAGQLAELRAEIAKGEK